MTKKPLAFTVFALGVTLIATTAHAAPFLVTVDTASLSGPQTIGFGLTNFNGDSNTISLADFSFDGGSAIAGSDDCTLGGTFTGLGCSGDLTSGVDLQDVDPVAAFFTQQFLPGASLSFVLTASNSFGGGVPDQFAMYLCDASLSACYSDDAATGAMLLLDLAGGTLSSSSVVLFGASAAGLAAPLVTEVSDSVPEPSILLWLGAGMIWVRRRLRGPVGAA